MKKLTTVFGLLSMLLLLTSFTSSADVGGKRSTAGKQDVPTDPYYISGTQANLMDFAAPIGGRRSTAGKQDVPTDPYYIVGLQSTLTQP
jgi:hypothetical protein